MKAKLVKEYLNEQLKYELDGDYLRYFINGDEIGYVEYHYEGTYFSEHLPNKKRQKEFYIATIVVYEKFRGNDYSTQMLDHVKDFAKQKGATIITLRVDHGMGFGKREPNRGLEKIYLRNGFKYQHTEEEAKLDDTKNLGAMSYEIK